MLGQFMKIALKIIVLWLIKNEKHVGLCVSLSLGLYTIDHSIATSRDSAWVGNCNSHEFKAFGAI